MVTKNVVSRYVVEDFLLALAKLINHGSCGGRFHAMFIDRDDDDTEDSNDVRCIVRGPFTDRTLESVRLVWSPDSPSLVIDEVRDDETTVDLKSFALADPALLTNVIRELHNGYGVSLFVRRDEERCPLLPETLMA